MCGDVVYIDGLGLVVVGVVYVDECMMIGVVWLLVWYFGDMCIVFMGLFGKFGCVVVWEFCVNGYDVIGMDIMGICGFDFV